MVTIIKTQQEPMAEKSALALALESGMRDEVYQALNILQLDIANAIVDNAWATLTSLYEEVSRLLFRYQHEIEAPEVSPAYVAGQLAAAQDIMAALREMRPAPEELQRVSSARRRAMLLHLYHERSATASELKGALKLDLPKISTLGKELEEAGFIRRSRFGKYSHYELTSRGYAVAAEIDRRRQAEAAEQPTLETVANELRNLQAQIQVQKEQNAALLHEFRSVEDRFLVRRSERGVRSSASSSKKTDRNSK